MENRIKELDGLRGIAVILVISFHLFKRAATLTEQPILREFSNLTTVGWVGVDIFFALSGFLITSILLKAKGSEHYFRNFYIRRILRIFPLYYVAIALVLLFVPNLEPEFINSRGRTLLLMMIYQQNWIPLLKNYYLTLYLGVTWSLAIEEQFYFLWPFIVYKLSREQLIKVGLSYIALSILARILGIIFWPDLTQISLFFYYAPFARFEEILFGGLLAVFLTFDGVRQKILRFSMTIFIASLSGFVALCLLSNTLNPTRANIPLTAGAYTTIALFSVGLIGIFITYPPQHLLRHIFQNSVLTFFGKHSYSMYLFHLIPVLLLLDILSRNSIHGWAIYVLYSAASLVATIAIALLTWNLLEKHMLNLKKYFEG
jgi:peptidoglycan/LPS O-acetylase OafA/YrhL